MSQLPPSQTSSLPWFPPVLGTVVIFLIFIGLVLFVRNVNRDSVQRYARIQQAIPGEAKVIQVGRSVLQKEQGTTNIRIRLEVTPREGSPYQMTVTWDVEQAAIPKVQEGKQIVVKIDREIRTLFISAWDGRNITGPIPMPQLLKNALSPTG